MSVFQRPSRRVPGSDFCARLWREQRGSVLALSVVTMAVLLAAGALAVDTGLLITARVHSQRAADAGALAGAQRLAMQGADATDAREEARDFANRHTVLNYPVEVKNTDVDVVNDTVRVRVRHSIETVFAKIINVDRMDVVTVAAAEAVPAGAAVCPLPIMIVDGYTDLDGDGLYDAGEPYTQCTDPLSPCTGFNLYTDDPENDIGLLIEVKSQNNSEAEATLGPKQKTCGAANPEWYCWVDELSGVGVGSAEIEDIINGCANTDFRVALGDNSESSPGNKQSATQELKTYIDNNDPSHVWHAGKKCVVDANDPSEQCVRSSDRIRPISVVDPTTISSAGNNARASVNNMVSVFLEKVASDFDQAHGQVPSPGQWNVYLRILGSAQGGGDPGGGAEGSLLQTVVLVE